VVIGVGSGPEVAVGETVAGGVGGGDCFAVWLADGEGLASGAPSPRGRNRNSSRMTSTRATTPRATINQMRPLLLFFSSGKIHSARGCSSLIGSPMTASDARCDRGRSCRRRGCRGAGCSCHAPFVRRTRGEIG